MLRIVLLSPSDEWRAPLRALLRERGADPWEASDPVDAISLIRDAGGGVLVLHTELGDDEVFLALVAAERRFGATVPRFVVGPLEGTLPAGTEHVEAAWRFASLCERLLAAASAGTGPAAPAATGGIGASARTATASVATGRPPAPSPASPPPPRPPERTHADDSWAAMGIVVEGQHGLPRLTLSLLEQLVRVARHESYYALLGVSFDASVDEVQNAGLEMLAVLSEEGLAPALREGGLELLREVRSAVIDGRDVLADPRLRAAYRPPADTPGQPSGRSLATGAPSA